MTLPGQLTHGLLTRDPLAEAMHQIAELRAEVRAIQAQTNTVTQYVSLDVENAPFTSSWTVYGSAGPFVVPPNCTNLTVFLWAAAGITFTTSGNVGVQVASGPTPGSMVGSGPAISVGGASGAAASVTTVLSGAASGYAPGANIYIGVNAYANGTYPANSGNCHCNGVLIWTRS